MTKLFAPVELLEKLHCSVCDAFLSIFPVHINFEGGDPICGRCKIPNENDYLRDEAYEGIAQFLIFPCSHAKHGCGEQLTPLKLKDHEACCSNRKVDCPSKTLSRCNWQGPNKDLKSHFESQHKNLLLMTRTFEIQFLNSIKENLLMPYEDELFIVKKEVDCRTETFVCSVEHVIQKENPDSYNYFIKVERPDSSCQHKFPERSTAPNSEDVTRFTADVVRELLRDPPAIVAYIEIMKTELKDDAPMVKREIKNPEVDKQLLAELECPVCLEYMLPPIYQCLKGHSICSSCKDKLGPCPICKTEIGNTQNFVLEKLTARLVYPCKYSKSGCCIALKSSDIKRHEDSCEYGPYDCPMSEVEKCNVKSNKSEIISHVENNHPSYILKSDKINVPFGGGDERMEKYYIIKFANRLFKVCFKYEDEKFYWALQLVGPAEECKKYKFEVDIIDNSEKKLRQYVRGLCVPYGKQSECFAKRGQYIIMLFDQLTDFITDNLSYRVRVVKEPNKLGEM